MAFVQTCFAVPGGGPVLCLVNVPVETHLPWLQQQCLAILHRRSCSLREVGQKSFQPNPISSSSETSTPENHFRFCLNPPSHPHLPRTQPAEMFCDSL